jgi:hypothetical protein
MVKTKKGMLWVKARVTLDNEKKVMAKFGYYKICPSIDIVVTDKLKAMDRKDLTILLEEEDPFIDVDIMMSVEDFIEIQEELGQKLARTVQNEIK